MTENPLSAAQALTDYRAGNFAAALAAAGAALPSADPQMRQTLLVVIANANLKLGKKGPAAEAFVMAARAMPDKRAAFLKFAANLFFDEERFEDISGIAVEAAVGNTDDKQLLFKLATAFKATGRLAEAEPFIAELDLIQPQHYALLGEFERALNDRDEFYRFLLDACRTRKDSLPLNSLRYARATNVCDLGAAEEFNALMLDRNNPVAELLCRNELAWSRLIRCDDESAHMLPSYDTLSLHRIDPEDIPKHRRTPSPAGERTRIGYLSNDFHWHATMILFQEVLQAHDRQKFDVTLFCYTDETAAQYQKQWPPVLRDALVSVRSMTDAEAARCVAEHRIDILVDLKGFTAGARLGIVNRSDAPVKATYLGYPGSLTGMDVDYAVADATVTPETSKPFYSEKLCRLPETYQANGSGGRLRPLPLGRDDFGIPKDRVILGSFNSVGKLTDVTLTLWADIMRRLPDAMLCLLCREGLPRQNLTAAFKRLGVAKERLIFFSNEPYEAYLARIAAVDLALDTHPYNGHTTTSDILWAGTPVVTFKGKSFASRVSESLLRAIGLPELVADDAAGFCDLAVELARGGERRRAIREKLEANRLAAPLFDTERFTRHLERAYEMMIERARAGLPPEHIDVPVLPARNGPFLA